jgi:hypothetical protein
VVAYFSRAANGEICVSTVSSPLAVFSHIPSTVADGADGVGRRKSTREVILMIRFPTRPSRLNADSMTGVSQAVRPPAEFWFEGSEADIRRDDVAGELVLSKPKR